MLSSVWASAVKKTWGYIESLRYRNERKRYLRHWYKHTQAGRRFAYIDESGFAPTAERTHGYAAKGEKVYGLRSGNRRPRTSLIAAKVGNRLIAPFLFEGTCNTAVFNSWLEKELCPNLGKDSVVVMDNATFHKSQATRDLISKTGAILLFLPPYSPDLNPSEQSFAHIKRYRQNHPENSLSEAVNMYC